jgi:hypothetical protein
MQGLVNGSRLKLYMDNRPTNHQYMPRKKLELCIMYIVAVKRRKRKGKSRKRRKRKKKLEKEEKAKNKMDKW